MYQVCITHMMDNKPWNAENKPTCTQFIVLLVPQSILDRFGCSRARFEENYIYYQMTGHDQLQFWSVMTGRSRSHGFLESAVIWPVAVMGRFGQMTWSDLTCKHYIFNTRKAPFPHVQTPCVDSAPSGLRQMVYSPQLDRSQPWNVQNLPEERQQRRSHL